MLNRLKGHWKQLRALVDKEALERELDEELTYHIDRETEKNIAEGMDPGEARRRAELDFRGRERYKEEVRDARWTRLVEDTVSDLRYGLRSLRGRPGFAAAAILTLALGIGGTTAVFSVVRGVLIEPLPYPESESLVRLYAWDDEEPSENLYVSAVHFREYRERAESFSDLVAMYTYQETGADLLVGDRPERVRTLQVSPGYFELLGAPLSRGRAFTEEEDRGQAVAILSEGLWRRLGPDVAPVGGTIELDGTPFTVAGVVRGLRDPVIGRVDVWVPEDLHGAGADVPGNHFLTVLGRLAPGVSPERAREEMMALDRRLAELYPEVADDSHFRLVLLRDDVVAAARPTLLLLLGAVGLVLLIAVVNVANLQMVRSLGRAHATAVRAAIGAGHGRIARQSLAESLLLAVAGGVAGLILAYVGVDLLLALGGDAVPRAHEIGVDGPVLSFTAGITIATGLAFGTAPAVRLAGVQPATSLRDATRGTSPGRFARARAVLVAGQVALALVLLVGASVLAVSMHRLLQVDLGIRTERVLTFQLNLPDGRYDEAARTGFHEELTRRLEALPEVRAAAAVQWPPASGTGYRWGTRPLTGPAVGGRESFIGGEQRIVAGDYFELLEIPLLEGRVFDERDGPEAPAVAVISQAAAERLFPGVSAIGQRLSAAGTEREVIGVVGNTANDVEGTPAAHIYHAHIQAANRRWAMTYILATRGEPLAMLPAVRAAVRDRDPTLVVHEPATLNDRLGRSRSRRAFAFALTTTFAGLALTLAVLGLYGVLAYLVGRRTREIGIRIALGARPRWIAGRVVRQGLAVTAAGVLIGIVGALAFARLLESLVYRTEATDPTILAAAAAALVLAAAVATAFPAAKAARVSPREALAEE